jgi:hypothetical protein
MNKIKISPIIKLKIAMLKSEKFKDSAPCRMHDINAD